MNRGQYLPGDSPMHCMDARAKLLSFLLLIVAIILCDSVPTYVVCILTCAIAGILTRLHPKILLESVLRIGWFFLLIFVLNALFFDVKDAFWRWGPVSLSLGGIWQGLNVVLRIALILTLSTGLTRTTPPMALISAIESLISPLRFLGVPVENVAVILSAAIQFIPTISEEVETIRKAQIARGARFESKKLTQRAAAMLPLLVPVFLSSFQRADELATAMEARGYRGAKHRTKRTKLPIPMRGWLTMIACSLVLALTVFLHIIF